MKEHKFIPGSLAPNPVLLTIRLCHLSQFKNTNLNKIQQFSFPCCFSKLFTHSFFLLPKLAVIQSRSWEPGGNRMWGTLQAPTRAARDVAFTLPQDRPLDGEHWEFRREKTDLRIERATEAILGPHEEVRGGAAAVTSLGNFLSWDQSKILFLWLLGYGEVPGIWGPRALRRNQNGVR